MSHFAEYQISAVIRLQGGPTMLMQTELCFFFFVIVAHISNGLDIMVFLLSPPGHAGVKRCVTLTGHAPTSWFSVFLPLLLRNVRWLNAFLPFYF